MKCYKLFFSFEGIKNNYGCYILIPIFIIHIISTFLFYLKDFKKIDIVIKDIIFAKKNWNYLYIIDVTLNSQQKIFYQFLEVDYLDLKLLDFRGFRIKIE